MDVLVAKAIWDDTSSSDSSAKEEICQVTWHMIFMDIDDRVKESSREVQPSDGEEAQSSEEEASSCEEELSSNNNEVNSSKLKQLFQTIACLTNSLFRSKDKVKLL